MMRYVLFIMLVSLVGRAVAQNDSPSEITPQVLQKIKADVEKEVTVLKQKLTKEGVAGDQLEFSLDTFRIQEVLSKCIDIDYSTMGMNQSVSEKTDAYDKLMNKYYNRLLKSLAPEDQKTLITAQKAWLAYRDAEFDLIATMTKDKYSGGGTIQSTIRVEAYSDLVVKRTIEIFNYFEGIFKEE